MEHVDWDVSVKVVPKAPQIEREQYHKYKNDYLFYSSKVIECDYQCRGWQLSVSTKY